MDNSAFEVSLCPCIPEQLLTACFDGTIGTHSLQSTNESVRSRAPVPTPKPDGTDVFGVPGFSCAAQPILLLKQPSKWLLTPVSSSFGYRGQLISVEDLPAGAGMIQTSVHVRKVLTETGVAKRARKLRDAVGSKTLDQFAKERAKEAR